MKLKKIKIKIGDELLKKEYPEMIKKEVDLNLYEEGKCPFCQNKRISHENCIYCGFDFENIR